MITSKQRAALRGMANTMQPLYQIGKEGVTPAVTAQLDDALEARELIKITVLETADVTAKEAIEILAGRLQAESVQCIGRNRALPPRKGKSENRALNRCAAGVAHRRKGVKPPGQRAKTQAGG